MLPLIKRYPVVVVTLIVLLATLGMLGTGWGQLAQLVASAFALGLAVHLGWGMAKDIARGHWGIDVLAFTAILATVVVGEYLAALIICLMLSGGEALEDYAQMRATKSLSSLLERVPVWAHRVEADGTIHDVRVAELMVADAVLVRPGEILPVDGVLLDPEGSFDESSLTGESMPVYKIAGESLLSGAVNGARAITLRASATAADSQYSRIVELVTEAAASRAPVVRLADRYAVPFTMLAYVIAGAAWWASGDPVRFAEVLVVATPCPLLIAAPVAFMGGMSRAARTGVIVKDGGTLERLAAVKSVAFDKTGTLTQGIPQLRSIHPVEGMGEEELLSLVAAAEQYSSHVLAASIVAAASDRSLAISAVRDASEVATHGVSALVGKRRVLVGKPAWIKSHVPDVRHYELASGESSVYVAVDGHFAGVLVLADALRPDAAETLWQLRSMGIQDLLMLTGDQQATADHIAGELGLTRVRAECMPEDKVNFVRGLTRRPVMMVGDGVNDAPVLAASEVGVAMGARGSTAASQSADVVIMTERISQAAQAVRIGKDTVHIAVQSIWLGIVLSVLLMLVAATGVLPAILGALSQEIVDLLTIFNALRALKGTQKFEVRPGSHSQGREAVAPGVNRPAE
ncbi:heavy metal translocating P-type ATPase [Paeniglutamicibacter kerguelensis]|uniref:Heavy metal translocating P-type ATPase n=1 Tax=Paeniglutamicibacter kerguelensis TaxID=254788 RepID=A0ABS4XCI0_9MICC|nr:heavy metal translocating P-type ATPase [Paeniglutamicibacter kerguelensis]MBP2386177.1 heavy metal translocating P-type ATPase [Paeniglutamicibacter kerguelensis]